MSLKAFFFNFVVIVWAILNFYYVESGRYISLRPSGGRISPYLEMETSKIQNGVETTTENLIPSKTYEKINNTTEASIKRQGKYKGAYINEKVKSSDYFRREIVRFTNEQLEHAFTTFLLLVFSSTGYIECPAFEEEGNNVIMSNSTGVYINNRTLQVEQTKEHNRLFFCPPCKKCKCCTRRKTPTPKEENKKPKKPQHELRPIEKPTKVSLRVSSGKKLSFYNKEECFCPQCPPCNVKDCETAEN